MLGLRSITIVSAWFLNLAEEGCGFGLGQALFQSSRQMSQQHLTTTTKEESSGRCLDAKCFRNPKVWGPAAWFFLHTVALSQEDRIPKEQQKRLARFFSQDLPWLLPCPKSGEKFRQHLANNTDLSPALQAGRQALVQWMVTMHNVVNRDLNKEELSFEEASKYYTKIYDSNHAPCFSEKGWTIGSIIKGLMAGVAASEKPCTASGCFRTPAVWGPPTWFFLHSMALARPKKISEQQQRHIQQFLAEDLSWLLPCPSCGENLRRRLPSMPSAKDVVHQGRDALVHWLVALHNSVNKDLNKTQVSFQRAIEIHADTFETGVAPCMRQNSLSLVQGPRPHF